ncbi:MAG: ribose-phosphate diphosphokinase [Candidatus Chromulinivorax sp.]
MKKITFKIIISFLVIITLHNYLFVSDTVNFTQNAILFSGNANHELAEKVAKNLGINLGKAKVSKFNDGEINIQIQENIRDKHVFIIQSTCPCAHQSINDNLMELILLIRTCKRASAATITVVTPYYGYARQDRKSSPRVPISAADVAMMIELSGADRIVTVDLHCGQIQGFFRDIPVDNLYGAQIFIPYISEKNLINPVVVAPDAGGVERANRFLKGLEQQGICADMALISKQRASAGVIASMNLIGNVQGCDAIIVDDICDTAGTLIKAAQLLKDCGAQRVFAVITHPVFSCNAIEKVKNSMIDELMVADTIPLQADIPENITYLSISELIAQAIYRINCGKSISELFQ